MNISEPTRAEESGAAPALPLRVDAWRGVVRRPGAVFGLVWLGLVAFFAVFAPLVSNGRPLVYHTLDGTGAIVRTGYPLFEGLSAVDLVLLAAGVVGPLAMIAPIRTGRAARVGALLTCGAHAIITLALIAATRGVVHPDRWFPALSVGHARIAYGVAVGLGVGVLFLSLPSTRRVGSRVALVLMTGAIAGAAGGYAWNAPLRETRYDEEIASGRARAVFTAVPYSPVQGGTERDLLAPGSPVEAVALPGAMRALARHAGPGEDRLHVAVSEAVRDAVEAAVRDSGLDAPKADSLAAELRTRHIAGRLPDGRAVVETIRSRPGPRFLLGTDAFGQDVLSQLLHACRLAISIGLVSTGIAVLIGVTLGALMGYFGGVIDLLLYRVVEVFMAVPLLFLMIVAAGVLPQELRTTYTMMAIIGCFTWTSAARFTRAEFLKLRGQDFVQSARALGLPLRSVLFRHMLPNAVTPVLVEASFGVAAAITIEATLSYLGLGPVDQPSWGRLLAGAYNQGGAFQWWLAAFPGGAIFLTVLSYNLLGEALRDAIDPRLRTPRV